jgi:hypothetical protein
MVNVLWLMVIGCCGTTLAAEVQRPVKVFILAGDESCLEQGLVSARSAGNDAFCLPYAPPVKDEVARKATCSVYKGAYIPGTNYDTLSPVVTGLVAFGEQRGKKGSAKSVSPPFPELAMQPGHTTVVRGYLTVPRSGRYEVRAGAGDSAHNLTTLEGQEVYRHSIGQTNPVVAVVPLEARKPYAFQTIYFGKPGPEIRVTQVGIPEALETLMAGTTNYAFLKDSSGRWTKRDDVMLYDAHPIHNNTRAAGRPLGIPDDPADPSCRLGPELMLGTVLGNAYDEPVFLLRFATRHPIWFLKGSRSLGHDYLPPSSGGDPALQGGWDVIHFNFGVWDATYRDATSKYYSGYSITSVEDFEKNLCTLVAKMKKTGATLIWASVTPVWEGEPGRRNADEDAFNRVAEKVMKENGVIIDDLNAEVRRQGLPKTTNVHDVGNLAPKVTKGILEAIAKRENNTKPLPRVLLIGDSITGSYLEKVTKDLDGKAAVFKNPGNAEDTWNGLERMDDWLDLKQYLLCGQEYLELVNGVNDSLAQFARFYPGYQGQGYEIAGLVWFQGMADSQSPACTAAYETNLVNLIHNLRRDLKVPSLPVVVAVPGSVNEKVREAQLAVGDPAKHPEFAGTVTRVDTKPYWSPDGQAKSFLETGSALGRALLDLAKRK